MNKKNRQTVTSITCEGDVVFVSEVNVSDLDLEILHYGPDEGSAIGHPVGIAGVVLVPLSLSGAAPCTVTATVSIVESSPLRLDAVQSCQLDLSCHKEPFVTSTSTYSNLI